VEGFIHSRVWDLKGISPAVSIMPTHSRRLRQLADANCPSS
jgi:hypothetical protein